MVASAWMCASPLSTSKTLNWASVSVAPLPTTSAKTTASIDFISWRSVCETAEQNGQVALAQLGISAALAVIRLRPTTYHSLLCIILTSESERKPSSSVLDSLGELGGGRPRQIVIFLPTLPPIWARQTEMAAEFTYLTPRTYRSRDMPRVEPLGDFQFSFIINEREVTRWCYSPLVPRPYFFPVYGPSGKS